MIKQPFCAIFIIDKTKESSDCFMNLIYNNFDDSASLFRNFLNIINSNLSKPLAFNLSYLIFSLINSESVVTSDLASSLNSNFFSSNDDSNQKRIWRFFNNPNLNLNNTFNLIINHVIKNVSNVRHDKLIVTLDHMFTKNNFVTLMFTLKIDNQAIPIWFSSEKTKSNCHCEIEKISRKKVFSEDFLFNAIDEVVSLLSPLNTKITFLADRWFFNLAILNHISNKGHYFCFRAKANSSVKAFVFDKKEGHKIYKHLYDLKSTTYHSVFFENIELGDIHFICNLSISRSVANDIDDDNWYIVSNIKPSTAIKTYGYRFGSIEMFFKSQKTNGFYLESTKTKNIHAFNNLYSLVCIASLWLNIIAVDYIKNHNHLKNKVNIKYNKKNKNGKLVRILSTFKLGLKLFKKVFNSHINYKLKFNFKLYL